MSKYLLLLTLISTEVFAQDADIEPEVCNEGESCIETTTAGGHQSVFKLIHIEDEMGTVVGSKLNVSSAITDIFYDGVTACYKGKISDICNIGELMAGNTNLEYSQGGHARIENFSCFALNGIVNFEYDVDSDYEPDLLLTRVKIEKCN